MGITALLMGMLSLCVACGSKGENLPKPDAIVTDELIYSEDNNNINSTENHYYDGNSVYYETASDQEDISADMDKSEPEQKTPYENDYEYL